MKFAPENRIMQRIAAAALVVVAPAAALAFDQSTGDEKTEKARKMDGEHEADSMMKEMTGKKLTAAMARERLEDWEETARKTGLKVIEKYGPPDEATTSMMVWRNNGPWKWSILTNNPTQHDFPAPHRDVLEQAINYSAPLDKYDELANYDGSVVLNRTEGEMSARCDQEGANFLALNLANDVATGEKTVAEARDYYGKAIKAFKSKSTMDPYMQDLKFDVVAASAEDADETIISGM